MAWLEDVEEARLYVETALRDQASIEEAGNEINAKKEQEVDEHAEGGMEKDPEYCLLNPEELLQHPYAASI